VINLTPVEKFLKAVRTAKDYNSKEIRLTIAEADALSDCVSAMLLQEREFTQKIMWLQDQLIVAQGSVVSSTSTVQLSGGSF
jgi:hypothetical protein